MDRTAVCGTRHPLGLHCEDEAGHKGMHFTYEKYAANTLKNLVSKDGDWVFTFIEWADNASFERTRQLEAI